MLGASLKLGVGMLIVAIIDHKQIVVDIHLKAFIFEIKESRSTLHVAKDTRSIGSALHEFTTNFQQELKTAIYVCGIAHVMEKDRFRDRHLRPKHKVNLLNCR